MGPVRRTINLIAALALTAAGLAALVYRILFADGWRGFMVAGAGLMTGLGLYWLWADFINADPKVES